MTGYVRPPVPDLVFHDRSGAVIPYGRRWEHLDGDGPQDTYSVTMHPERFAPLVTVARAVVAHLATTYAVTVRERGPEVEVRPHDPRAAGLTFTFTDFPWVKVRAGATVELIEMCGCDHCDEDVDWMMEELEARVASVVDGRLREWLNDHDRPARDDELFLAHAFDAPDGSPSSSGSSSVDDPVARDRLREVFKDVPDRWRPWTARPAP